MIESLRKPLKSNSYFYSACTNKSLQFHRLSPGMDGPKEQAQKQDMLAGMCSDYCSDTLILYRHAFEAWKDLAKVDPMLGFFEMTLCSRLICGMGNKNVQECGATFLMPWGVPVIPGSAIKGVASSFASASGGDEWQKSVAAPFRAAGKHALVAFGGLKLTDSRKESYASGVDYLDAWWIPDDPPAPFKKDILTPHNKSYLTGDNPAWPDGTENPVPVHFLAIKSGQRFLFGLRGPKDLRGIARDIIRRALLPQGPGIGSKTRLGYGRFSWKKSEEEMASETDALLEELYAVLCAPGTSNDDARAFATHKKLAKRGIDKASEIARKVYEKAKVRFPESTWPDKVFGP